jgi:N-dimethylarginine dimethylaminohydrolase
MEVTGTRLYGCQSMTAVLRRVLVRRPAAADLAGWKEYGWREAPDPPGLAREHEAFCRVLEQTGAEVIVAEAPVDTGIDALYPYDPVLVANDGAVLLRPGKEARRGEVETIAADVIAAGIPVAARLEAPAEAEGGDTLWLDERTLLVGLGYRTNAAGARALAAALPGVDVVTFDLPHFRGPGEVLHLMSFISPLADDLAVVYPPLMPVRLVELLAERGIELVEVPDEEFGTMGSNILALAPRTALALEGNDETRRRLRRAGVEVLVYKGDEISRKGDGGPTCLTRPLLRR